MYGYHPKPSKSWLIVKPEFKEEADRLFSDVQVTDTGHRYLGSYIGSESGLQEFINNEIESWNADIEGLSKIASSEPQLAYSAFVFGTSRRWNFTTRTTPGISELLHALEYKIKDTFIPAIVGKLFVPDYLRDIFSLPAKMGGLGITNVEETAEMEYKNSLQATASLADAIYNQHNTFRPDEHAQKEIMKDIKKRRHDHFTKSKSDILQSSSAPLIRQLELLSEKGASCWLTALPLKVCGFLFNKQEFHNAIALRYNLTLSDLDRPKVCHCGQTNNINHCLICKLGGYVSLRHDSLLKKTAKMMAAAGCKDVKEEPPLINVTTEQLPEGTSKKDGARLDVSARGLWRSLDRTFIDIRVLHPQAQSNSRHKTLKQMYRAHEEQKKKQYNARVLQVEKATFSPIVFSRTGGMGDEATLFYKKLAKKTSKKTGQELCDVTCYMRRRLRFELLKTCLISLRGYRGKPKEVNKKADEMEDLDLNLLLTSVY